MRLRKHQLQYQLYRQKPLNLRKPPRTNQQKKEMTKRELRQDLKKHLPQRILKSRRTRMVTRLRMRKNFSSMMTTKKP